MKSTLKTDISNNNQDQTITSTDDDHPITLDEMLVIYDSVKFNDIYQEYEGKTIFPVSKPMASPKPNAVKRLNMLFGDGVVEILSRLCSYDGVTTKKECYDLLYPLDHNIDKDDFFTIAENLNVLSKYIVDKKEYYILSNALVRKQLNTTKVIIEFCESKVQGSPHPIHAFTDTRQNGEFPERYFRQLIAVHNSSEKIKDGYFSIVAYQNGHFILLWEISDKIFSFISCTSKELQNMTLPSSCMFLLSDIPEKDVDYPNFECKVPNVFFPKDGTIAFYDKGAWHTLYQHADLLRKVTNSQANKAKLDQKLQTITTDIQQIEKQNAEFKNTIHAIETQNLTTKYPSANDQSVASTLTASIYYPPTLQQAQVIESIQAALKYTSVTNPGVDGSRRQELLAKLFFLTPGSSQPLSSPNSSVQTVEISTVPDFSPTTLGQITEYTMYGTLLSLLDESESAIAEQTKLLAEYDTRYEQSFFRNEELEAELRTQESLAAAMEKQYTSSLTKAILPSISVFINDIHEFYAFEFHDFILKVIDYYLRTSSDSANSILTGIVASNKLLNEEACLSLEKSLEKTASAFRNSNEEGKHAASVSNFIVTTNGKHNKLCFRANNRYTFVTGCTPSDQKAAKNFEMLLKNKLLCYRNL